MKHHLYNHTWFNCESKKNKKKSNRNTNDLEIKYQLEEGIYTSKYDPMEKHRYLCFPKEKHLPKNNRTHTKMRKSHRISNNMGYSYE